MVSWRNPTADQADLSLEDYRERGVIAALDAVNAIVPERKVHAVGYCLGGTILAIAAATMAHDNDERLASISLMAAQVDFAEAGELLLFLEESQIAFVEDIMWEKGYLDRPQMARAFSAIRSDNLIYSRAVRRYYLGKEDVPTDMGVWVSDATRMPARMHSEYLRGMFLENRLTAGRFAVNGRVIALKDISAPIFAVGTETDHIAPGKSVYKTQLFTDRDMTFVLTSGGHNSGIINETKLARGHHRISRRAAGRFMPAPKHGLRKIRRNRALDGPRGNLGWRGKAAVSCRHPPLVRQIRAWSQSCRHPAPTFIKPDPKPAFDAGRPRREDASPGHKMKQGDS